MFDVELMHSGEIILSVLMALPIAGALFLALVPATKAQLCRNVGILFSGAALVVSLVLWGKFALEGPGFQFVERVPWLPSVGAEYIVGIDGLSLCLLVLTTLLSFLVIVASNDVQKNPRAYLANILILETGMLGALMALDGVLFYIFWELMLIPMYFLIGVWGHERRIYAAIKFVLYTALGSVLMLVAIVYLAYAHKEQFGELSFYLGDWANLSLDPSVQLAVFSAFALAFAIKVPVFGLHTWLPDAHVEAPTGGSVILAGVMLKMGLYGFIRFGFPIFPDALTQSAPLFVVLGVVGIIYGALVAWAQTDMKKLVAYSSVSHLGFCVLGFASLNLEGLQGCMLQMLNHGVSTAALFFLVGALYYRKHTRLIADFGGIGAKVPVFAFVFLVFTLSSIGLPSTNGFVGEYLILFGGFKNASLAGALAVLGVVLGAVYMLSLYRRVIFGSLNAEKNSDLPDLTPTEKFVFAPLLVLVFVIGLYPMPVLKRTEQTALRALACLEQGSQMKGSEMTVAGLKEGGS